MLVVMILQHSPVFLPSFQVTLCKDGDGKVGMRVKAINKGVFVCLVKKNSPAAMAGECCCLVVLTCCSQ